MIENQEYLAGITRLGFPVKGPLGRPLTTSDDIAVKILVDEEDDSYAGYTTLTEVLNQLITAVKGTGDTTPGTMDTLPEVINYINTHKGAGDIVIDSDSIEIEDTTDTGYDDVF